MLGMSLPSSRRHPIGGPLFMSFDHFLAPGCGLGKVVKFGAYGVGVGDVEVGVEGQCFLPVMAGLVVLDGGMVDMGEAVVRAALLAPVVEFDRQGQGGR